MKFWELVPRDSCPELLPIRGMNFHMHQSDIILFDTSSILEINIHRFHMSDSQENRYTQAEVDAIVAALEQDLAQAQTEIRQLREQVSALWAEHLRRSLDSAISSSKTYHRSVLTNRCVP